MEIPVRKIDGKPTTLGEFAGKVVLIVNVASKCGLTPQYEGLQRIYDKYSSKGLVIAGFPANEFGAQEPGENTEIVEFCSKNYGVSFPMFEKIVVKGPGIHPLYAALTQSQPTSKKHLASGLASKLKGLGLLSGGPADILWNFEKFLIGRDGEIVARFAPDVKPEDPMVIEAIEALLAE